MKKLTIDLIRFFAPILLAYLIGMAAIILTA
jgi:hypothetical protein